jgi:hypothetical protein
VKGKCTLLDRHDFDFARPRHDDDAGSMVGSISPLLRSRFAALGACVWLVSCGSDRNGPPTGSLPQPNRAVEPAWFIDATAATGLDFVHFNGMTGEF